MQVATTNRILLMQQATYPYLNQMPALAIIYSNRKKPVVKTALPAVSILSQQPCDYCESYVITHKDPFCEIVPGDLLCAFDFVLSSWLKPINQHREINGVQQPGYACGETTTGYQVMHKSETEIVVAKAGKHLAIRHSLLLQKARKNASQINTSFSTVISFNTATGQLYFMLLKPFLKFLAPLLLKRIVRHL